MPTRAARDFARLRHSANVRALLDVLNGDVFFREVSARRLVNDLAKRLLAARTGDSRRLLLFWAEERDESQHAPIEAAWTGAVEIVDRGWVSALAQCPECGRWFFSRRLTCSLVCGARERAAAERARTQRARSTVAMRQQLAREWRRVVGPCADHELPSPSAMRRELEDLKKHRA